MSTKPIAFIVEDDPQLSQIFTLTLEDEFEVHTINDGNEAVIRLSNETPHIILLDLNLPEISGEGILAFIRSNKRLQKAVVILCTANERLADTLHDQADFILLKPISPIQLREIASRLK